MSSRAGPGGSFLFFFFVAVGYVVQALTHSAARSPPLVVAIAPTSILAFLSLSLSLSSRAPSTVRQPPFVWTLVAHQTVTFKHFRGKSFQSWTGAGEGGGRDRSEASSATLRLVRLLEPRSRHGKVRPVGELSRRKTELRVSNVKESRRSPASSGCPALPPPSKGRALP